MGSSTPNTRSFCFVTITALLLPACGPESDPDEDVTQAGLSIGSVRVSSGNAPQTWCGPIRLTSTGGNKTVYGNLNVVETAANCSLGGDADTCGNGQVDPGEACDGSPCCSSSCTHLQDGTACPGGRCNNGTCTPEAFCGNGQVDPGESCDGEGCCTSDCKVAPQFTVCRPAANDCDSVEKCNGLSSTCPADFPKWDGSPCGGGGTCKSGVCILPAVCGNNSVETGEACDGGPCCTANCTIKPDGTLCSGGSCQNGTCQAVQCGNNLVEPGEVCDGGDCCTAGCTFASSSTVCRAAGSECDLAETCSGSAADCPANVYKPDGTKCSVGVCQAGVCPNETPTNGIAYVYTDAMGTPVSAVNEDAQLLWRRTHGPYGQPSRKRAADGPHPLGFTAKMHDTEIGLVHLGARYYSPAVGRFYSIDPVGFEEDSVHSFNRYTYAHNNPLRFVDPDGRAALDLMSGPELDDRTLRRFSTSGGATASGVDQVMLVAALAAPALATTLVREVAAEVATEATTEFVIRAVGGAFDNPVLNANGRAWFEVVKGKKALAKQLVSALNKGKPGAITAHQLNRYGWRGSNTEAEVWVTNVKTLKRMNPGLKFESNVPGRAHAGELRISGKPNQPLRGVKAFRFQRPKD